MTEEESKLRSTPLDSRRLVQIWQLAYLVFIVYYLLNKRVLILGEFIGGLLWIRIK